ncbi:hypothetical protein YYC_00715 [Plasmodium yoelii 17X]|uniref:ENTH domain-containing protein n=1 Tax=Plasmodium yoelii 17X TaxID=1323249 RepID=V7PU93_PLAYE|nr:hypothetical protein YYC_00715 [Plasmodium yoelii 17X]
MNRLILNKATSSNDEPTPGYLYNEISQMAFCSKESLNMVGEYLLKKLQRTDLNVKLKTLKILKHLCDKKRSDFRNFLKKKIDIIKECQNCNIVHDQLKGDTPSMLVRKEATDLIKIIYSYETVENNIKTIPNSSQDNIIKNNRIEGFGNNVFQKDLNNYPRENNTNYIYNNNISGNNNNSNNFYDLPNMRQQFNGKNMNYQSNSTFNNSNNYMNKMPGFGNPYFNQNPVQKTKSEIAIKYLNEVANKYIPSSFVNKINKVSTTISKNYSNGSLNFQNIIGGNSFNKNFEKGNMKYFDGRNTGWTSNNNNFNNNTKYYKNNKGKEKMKNPQESQESGLYENKIIDDVLNTTGINKVPCENIVNEFVQKCDTLDTKVIISILTSRLKTNFMDEESNWKYKIKVLHVIKHLLIHRKNKKNNEQIIETFEILLDNLKRQTMEELYKCKEIKQLKKLAIEIFVLMGLKEKQQNEETLKTTVQRNDQNVNAPNFEIPNLLDFDDDPINITTTNNNHVSTDMFKDSNANKNFRDIDIDLINFENNSNNNTKKNDESFNTVIRNIDNMSLPNSMSKNTELFNSLNVKCPSNSYNNIDTNFSDNNITNEKCKEQNNSINSYGKVNNNAFLNDLILLNPENTQKNTNKYNDNIIKSQNKKSNLNNGDDFFNLGSTDNIKNNKDNISSLKNTYFEDMEKLQFSKGSNNIDNKNKYYEQNKINNKLNIEPLESENTQFYDKNNFNNTKEKNSNDACLIDINDNLTDISIKKNNNVNTFYIDQKGSENYHTQNNNNQTNVLPKKYSSDFINNSINTNDDKINHFFNTFTISPKKPEKPNEKPNVKIDAFELMADEMKL